jgi:hypothetical protein
MEIGDRERKLLVGEVLDRGEISGVVEQRGMIGGLRDGAGDGGDVIIGDEVESGVEDNGEEDYASEEETDLPATKPSRRVLHLDARSTIKKFQVHSPHHHDPQSEFREES